MVSRFGRWRVSRFLLVWILLPSNSCFAQVSHCAGRGASNEWYSEETNLPARFTAASFVGDVSAERSRAFSKKACARFVEPVFLRIGMLWRRWRQMTRPLTMGETWVWMDDAQKEQRLTPLHNASISTFPASIETSTWQVPPKMCCNLNREWSVLEHWVFALNNTGKEASLHFVGNSLF